MSAKMESHSNTMTLIQGEYSVSDATDQLMKMYDDSLRYHGRRAFSSEIRFGTTDEQAQAMLKALDQARQDTLALLNQANDQGQKVKIQAAIHISVA